MIKKLFTAAAFITLVVAGWFVYNVLHVTPERAAERFVTQLAQGETETAYRQLTPELTAGREQYWKTYLSQFKNEQATPRLVGQTPIEDDFNTYTDASEPQNFTYELRVGDKTYRLTCLLIKQQNKWAIDELRGGYL